MSYYAIPNTKEHASVSWTTHFDTNICFELNLALRVIPLFQYLTAGGHDR